MPPKPKAVVKSVKTVTKKSAAKVKPATKKVVARPNATVKPATKKAAPKARTGKKKTEGVIQTVKEGVQTGIQAVGDLVKKVTPNALLTKSAKSKRK